MSRADELRVAYETLEAGPLRLRVLDDHSLVAAEHAAIPDLLAVARAARIQTTRHRRCGCCGLAWDSWSEERHTSDCALAAFEAGGKP